MPNLRESGFGISFVKTAFLLATVAFVPAFAEEPAIATIRITVGAEARPVAGPP